MDSGFIRLPPNSPHQPVQLLNLGGIFQSPASFGNSSCPSHTAGQLNQCLCGTQASWIVFKASQLIPMSRWDWEPLLQSVPQNTQLGDSGMKWTLSSATYQGRRALGWRDFHALLVHLPGTNEWFHFYIGLTYLCHSVWELKTVCIWNWPTKLHLT